MKLKSYIKIFEELLLDPINQQIKFKDGDQYVIFRFGKDFMTISIDGKLIPISLDIVDINDFFNYINDFIKDKGVKPKQLFVELLPGVLESGVELSSTDDFILLSLDVAFKDGHGYRKHISIDKEQSEQLLVNLGYWLEHKEIKDIVI